MKLMKSIIVTLLLVCLISCEKEAEPKTTYSFKNESTSVVYDFDTYYWDGERENEKVTHGDLKLGEETERVETDAPLIGFTFAFDPGGIGYFSTEEYEIEKNQHNQFEIDDNTTIYGGTTFVIYNYSSYTLYDAWSFAYDGVNFYEEITHGTINKNHRTNHYETGLSHRYVAFFANPGQNENDLIITNPPFNIGSNTINWLYIDNTTNVVSQNKALKEKVLKMYKKNKAN